MKKSHLFYLMMIIFLFNYNAFAHVELTYPEGGETFYSGDTITITWVEVQAHDVQNWELYYSSDGAETWQVISNNIEASLRAYDWIIPEEETTIGRIRVVQNNTEIDYEDVSVNIKIVNITSIEEKQNELSVNSITAYPNPFVSAAKIKFTIYEKKHVSLDILQLNGKKVATLIDQYLTPDTYVIEWKPEYITSETYVVVIKVGQQQKAIKLQQLSHKDSFNY